jgi:NADH/F420H2 dehydrogenase subunit C
MPMAADELPELRTRMEKALRPGTIQEVLANGAMVIRPISLLRACYYLRDQEGFDYLSNVSGVDWIEQGQFEVVYHLYALRRGERLTLGQNPGGLLGPLVLKVRVPREDPIVPSVTSVWPSALWQERETFDMLGIRFEGHPDLRRIYLWDEFKDHPLRKDYVPEEA